MNSEATEKSSIAKNTQPTTTNENVIILEQNAGIESSAFLKNNLSRIKNAPWKSPHHRKLHDAPCHIPLIAITTTSFGSRLAFVLTLFPPSGMYK